MKPVQKIYTGQVDDKLKVLEKYTDFYEGVYEREKIFKRIIYLNGVNFVNGVQGTGKTYLVKSILNNKEVKPNLNNVFWLQKPVDVDFIQQFLNLKEVLFEGLFLLFQNKLSGEYLKKWQHACEKDHFIIGKERFDFNPFDPNKFDLIIIDDVATNGSVNLLITYATVLRHLHCGMVFIAQSETIINKKFRDLLSMYILFNDPDDKILKPQLRKEVKFLLSQRISSREAVCIDLIENTLYIITANNEGEECCEEKTYPKKTDIQKFKEMIDLIE